MTLDNAGRSVRLLLVRHGPTGWNLEGRYTSTTDVRLHASARAALAPTARLIERSEIGRVLTSPMKRAVETAEILRDLGAIDVAHEVDADLRELDFGRFEGRSRGEMRAGALADAYEDWMRVREGFAAAPGGEDLSSASGRATRVLEKVRAGEADTLVVSHGYLLRILVVTAVPRLPVSAIRSMPLANGSVTELSFGRGGEWSLLSHNQLGAPVEEAISPSDRG